MSDSKTRKTQQASASSDRVIRLTAPVRWNMLSQEQLRYVLTLLADGFEGVALKTYMLVRFTGIEVIGRRKEGWKCAKDNQVFYLSREQVASMIEQMGFVDRFGDMCVRLDDVGSLRAVDPLLHRVPFGDYLKMEIAYQGYNISHKEQPLRSLCRLLYRDEQGRTVDGVKASEAELLGAFLWFAHIKQVFAQTFSDLFRPASSDDDEPQSYDVMELIDAQVRALTDGDVTKEEAVRHIDTWRALTELNAKAKEAREMRARLKK